MVAGRRLAFHEKSEALQLAEVGHVIKGKLWERIYKQSSCRQTERHMGTIWVIGLRLDTGVLLYQKKPEPAQF